MINQVFALHVIGEDNRLPAVGLDPHWQKVGKLIGPRGACSAFLVSENMAMTAAHCIYDENGNPSIGRYQLLLGFNHGKSIAKANVISIVEPGYGKNLKQGQRNKIFESMAFDIALLLIDQPLGRQFGFFKLQEFTTQQLKNLKVNNLGYPSDVHQGLEMTVHQDCQIQDVNLDTSFRPTVLKNTCDMRTGSSGGPLYFINEKNEPIVVGIMTLEVGEAVEKKVGEKVDEKVGEAVEEKVSNQENLANSLSPWVLWAQISIANELEHKEAVLKQIKSKSNPGQ